MESPARNQKTGTERSHRRARAKAAEPVAHRAGLPGSELENQRPGAVGVGAPCHEQESSVRGQPQRLSSRSRRIAVALRFEQRAASIFGQERELGGIAVHARDAEPAIALAVCVGGHRARAERKAKLTGARVRRHRFGGEVRGFEVAECLELEQRAVAHRAGDEGSRLDQ